MIKKDAIKIFDSISDNFSNAVSGGPWAPVNGVTYCNFFVSGVCVGMGYKGFTYGGTSTPMIANKMVDFMEDPKNGWLKVSSEVAQSHANAGVLVIAGKKEDPHGHVCVVRPGEPQMSGNWKKKAPRVANVGRTVFINNNCAWAFHEEPNFYCLAEMI